MKIIAATQNLNKVKEINQLLQGSEIEISCLQDIGITEEIPETGATLEENALIKARYIHSKLKKNVFSEDTGLEVPMLNNEPGVRSARYAGEAKSAEDNMSLLLLNLKGKSDRKARFRTIIALIFDGKEYLFEGKVDGDISTDQKGEEGFGYDPIFVPSNSDRSFAQMTNAEKSKISHRGRAVTKLIQFLQSNEKIKKD